MKRKNVTKHALVVSIVSMVLCCTMFMGTTYAWFTDSVTSANNKIASGTLDIDFLRYNEEKEVYESIKDKEGAIFDEKNGVNWEPGKTEVVHFQVKNQGNLYLKYDFILSVIDYGLNGALDYAIVEGNYETVSALDSWEKIVERVGEQKVHLLQEGKYTVFQNQILAPKDDIDSSKSDQTYFALAVHMKEGIGNEYQGKTLSLDASIFATQASKEEDSFGADYDASATYGYVSYTGGDFKTYFADTPDGNTIYLDMPLTEGQVFEIGSLSVTGSKTIDAAGKEISIKDGLFIEEGAKLTIKNAKMSSLSVSGNGTLGLTSVTIEGAQKDALKVESGNLKLVVKGYTVLTGNVSGNGIFVASGSTLDLSGSGKLMAIGNAGTENRDATEEGGSGIGGHGTIYIHKMANLTAEGYGKHAFGIGGNGLKVIIEETNIAYVKGGFVQQKFISDTKYGKSEPEGGAAIGGSEISLNKVIIDRADGGSKAAGIGAQYHQPVKIEIVDSTIKSVIGGNASAAIGGSRIKGEEQKAQTVDITIVNSTINAIGGEYGAGIGSGYDTHCSESDYLASPICTIRIKGTSKIDAKGGKYAAGIGTGYHAGGLAGEIESTVTVNAVSGEKFYKDAYTKAQDIGFGVVDPAREGKTAVDCSFKYGDNIITFPTP